MIITQGANTIYGEKASLAFETGDANVTGNVRYVDNTMTMYGSKLDYNFNTQRLDVYNARILSDFYVVLGEQLSRVGKNEIYGRDAEYSTCKDCPESWSVFGREIRITVGEYIRIKHAYIKVNGVVVLYIPYIVLPIKKDRETGLLFPSFGLNVDEGVRFQQPFFWAISPHMDMTLTPGYFGNRGFGGEVEFRHTPQDGLWYHFDSLMINDGIYLPGKVERDKSGTEVNRNFYQWEHHYNTSSDFNHHFMFNQARDFDVLRDFQYYTGNKILGPDTGAEGFFEFRKDQLQLSIEAGLRENLLFESPTEFDDRYVQILPRVSLDFNTFTLFQPQVTGLDKISFGGHIDHTIFKQNNTIENRFIRNAHRINANPYLIFNIGQIGPVNIETRSELDYQYYHFPEEREARYFQKHALLQETELSITLDKVFGLSYREFIPSEMLKVEKNNVKKKKSNIIGDLPSLEEAGNNAYEILHNSYQHSQVFKLRHIFLADDSLKGSEAFADQIRTNEGVFDPIDNIRAEEFRALNETSRTGLPVTNTLEFQWNNRLLRKSVNKRSDFYQDDRGLRENFNYSSKASFNVSQGINLDLDTDADGKKLDIDERLTRLLINTNFSINRTSINLSEYYFWSTRESILQTSISQNFSFGSFSAFGRYNSFRVPTDKFVGYSANISFSDLLTAFTTWEYDLSQKFTNQSQYGFTYRPRNNCWIFQFAYLKSIAEKRVTFNFLFNFGNNTFTGVMDNEG